MKNHHRKFSKNYLVVVLEMFNYGSSYDLDDYDTYDEAVAAAKEVVLSSFSKKGKEGYKEWLIFGDDAIIISINGAPEMPFSIDSQNLVKKVCGI